MLELRNPQALFNPSQHYDVTKATIVTGCWAIKRTSVWVHPRGCQRSIWCVVERPHQALDSRQCLGNRLCVAEAA